MVGCQAWNFSRSRPTIIFRPSPSAGLITTCSTPTLSYRLGDGMLLSGFVPHRTYIEPGMTQERTSVDFRFFGSAVPNPIYARPVIAGLKESARWAKAAVKRRAERLLPDRGQSQEDRTPP